jgi:hypothetical protein
VAPTLSRRAYFFPHSLDPQQKRGEPNLSGRVPFDVEATTLGPNGVRQGSCVVMVDGFLDPASGAGLLGPSQDPCVFSAPSGPFHTFARIDGSNPASEKVVAAGKIIADCLLDVVEKGDIVIFGKTTPPSGKAIEQVWVDTVLVVDSVVALPASEEEKGPWPFPVVDAEVVAPKGSDGFRFNLADGEKPKGTRTTTQRNPHRILCGQTSTDPRAVAALETSFVPLADRTGGICRVCAVDRGHLGADWAPLITFFQQQVYAKVKGIPRGGWIAQFESFALAEALLTAIVKRSGGHQNLRGTVAIPPLSPVSTKQRWDTKSARVSGVA